jgi:hypothetical protein
VLGLSAAWGEEKVTIIRSDSEGNITVRHDAIADLPDESYATITVKKAPPAPMNEEEFSKLSPDATAVWIPGYWRWNTSSSEYEWISGVWRRQVPNQTWHPGQWLNNGDTYSWQTGYWGPEGETKIIYVKEAPPAFIEETKGTAPGTDHIWIPGVWRHDGTKYVWLPGSWERPASEDLSWVPGVWFKTTSGHEFVPGHWDYTPETRTYIVKTK